jgi:hypothetical protein
LGGEACRFYLEGEPGEEFSPSAETNVALAARHHVTDHMTPEWSGCDSQQIILFNSFKIILFIIINRFIYYYYIAILTNKIIYNNLF